jgi:hypothetical protein
VGSLSRCRGRARVHPVEAWGETQSVEDGDPAADPSDPEVFAAGAKAWIAQVEADPAFGVPMTRHPADRFTFGVDDIG